MAEPLRLAQFLRERCARNQYGLQYLNPEKTLLLIPWPVVPRPNEEAPPGFQMFYEWAEQSHRRRGKNEAAEQRESATLQKHRFRNALARANGIVYRRDINVEGARVYELVDSKRNTIDAPSPYDNEDDFGDDPADFLNETSSAYTLSPTDNFTGFPTQPAPPNTIHVDEFNPGYYPIPFTHAETPVVPPIVSPSLPASQQVTVNDGMDGIAPYNNNQDDINGLLRLSTQPLTSEDQLNVPGPSNVHQFQYVDPVPLPPDNGPPELEIQVRFRQEDALVKTVTNKLGCRVYFGKNIPDLSQLLEKEHLENLMSKFRFDKEWYYGPESLQQVQLPRPEVYMKSTIQTEKTTAILANMDRGLLLFIENAKASTQMNVPDVFAMRLCQTRIFPCYKNAGQPHTTGESTLKRMEWTKVFDGKIFCEQLMATEGACGMESYPSPSFFFSLGQKPSGEERSFLLVCLTVTVHRAQQLIQSKLDSERGDICISYINSTDVEARSLATRLTETLTL